MVPTIFPDPTTARDLYRRFTLDHLPQLNRAYGEVQRRVYERRPEVRHWTVDVDAKGHKVYGEKRKGAAKSGRGTLFEVLSYSYYVLVTNGEDEIKKGLELHNKRATRERRITQFTNEFLFHLPMENFMGN